VEYALETVRRGTIALGLRGVDGVILAVEERTRKLQTPTLSQKIFQVDDHVGVAAAGYVPDARVLVDKARVFAQSNHLLYDESVDVESVAKYLGDLTQEFTQYAGVRPFGVSLIISGVDRKGSSVFLVDPSGSYLQYEAVSIGAGSDQVTQFLESNFNTSMSIEELAVLAVKSIYLVSEDKASVSHIRIASIDNKTKKLRRYTEEEVMKFATMSKEKFNTQ
jgi:proteasome alpha subunit